MAKAELSAMKDLPAKTQELVAKETEQILMAWRRSVLEIISIGKSLERIREALPNALFCAHLGKLGLNQNQASRFINVYRRFGSSTQSAKVLQSKVSVLYLLGTATDLKKVEHLANGGSIVVSGQRKTIEQLKVEDAVKIRKGSKRPTTVEPTAAQIDRKRCATAYQLLGDLAQDIETWAADLIRFKKKGFVIQNQKMLLETLRECRTLVSDCISALQ